jgi:hypothetical protein
MDTTVKSDKARISSSQQNDIKFSRSLSLLLIKRPSSKDTRRLQEERSSDFNWSLVLSLLDYGHQGR